jgi:hypothetical protein
MGAFSQLAMDIRDRESKPAEWAVMLSDESRPATIWRIIGESRGFYLLEHGKLSGVQVHQKVNECWVIA